MINKLKQAVIVSICIFVFTELLYSEEGGIQTPLKMTVKAEKKHYAVGDTIEFIIEWENLTDNELTFVAIPKGLVYKADWFGIYDDKNNKMRSLPLEYIKPAIDEAKETVTIKPKKTHSKTIVGTVKKKLSYYDYAADKSAYYGGMYVEFKYNSAIFLTTYDKYSLKADLEFAYGKDKGCWTGRLVSEASFVWFRANNDMMKTVGRTHRKVR